MPILTDITIGVDFGGNKSNHAFVASSTTSDNKVYVLKAKSIPATGMDVSELVEHFQKFASYVEKEYGKNKRSIL